jgi:hypothetical protein
MYLIILLLLVQASGTAWRAGSFNLARSFCSRSPTKKIDSQGELFLGKTGVGSTDLAAYSAA